MDANSPELKSFLPVKKDSPFPIQNLPFGVFTLKNGSTHCGCAIGEYILDITVLEEHEYFKFPHTVFNSGSLNPFINLGRRYWRETRQKISELLRSDNPTLRDNTSLLDKALVLQKDVNMVLPVHIGDYTDFYSSQEHATNIGLMIRDPKMPLLPNWKHIPVGYHGRSSSIVVSGTPVIRPTGQILNGESPIFHPTKRLDYELELAFIVGKNSKQGQPVRVEEADDYIFGFVLMNDWSARDIQRWEYQPLGPFVSKSFSTSISAWIVLAEALEPFRTKGPEHEHEPFPYLKEISNKTHYDINLEVSMKTKNQNEETNLSHSNAKLIYWSPRQQLAHHTITGCNIKVGDLMASGTISGKEKDSYGSLMELSWNGTQKVSVGSEQRTFIEDGDQVTLKGYCEGNGYRIGFGDVQGQILPALDFKF